MSRTMSRPVVATAGHSPEVGSCCSSPELFMEKRREGERGRKRIRGIKRSREKERGVSPHLWGGNFHREEWIERGGCK